jgi:hypothetical protein
VQFLLRSLIPGLDVKLSTTFLARPTVLSAVGAWGGGNARTELLFYPTFRTALAAGLPWLEYMCPGCRQGTVTLTE